MSASRWLEVRIPISPRAYYFNQVRVIALSIRSLGGRYADTLIRVSVGADQEPEDLYRRLPWSHALGIEWHWVDRAEFVSWKGTAHPYIATMMERFRPPFTAENVLMIDADVVAMRPFDELFDLMAARPGVVGVLANVSPFTGGNHADCWRRFYALTRLGEPAFEFVHPGWGVMDQDRIPDWQMTPAYFNTGVLMAPAVVFEKLYATYLGMLDVVRGVMNTYFFEQIALTLALLKAGIAYHVVPLRYNYPNDPRFDAAYPEELREIRFLHFLRSGIIQREGDFQTLAATAGLAARRDLEGSNEAFRRRIAELLPSVLEADGVASGHTA